jgi:soluble lytic murein transglycosylase-like protein
VAAEEAALAGVGTGVQASIGADAEAEAARRDAARARARQARTVRALYSVGGDLGVYASVLGADSVEEALGRTMVARRVLADAARDAEAAAVAAREAGGRAVVADDALADRLVTAADVAEASRRVEGTLAEARASLASLTEEATRLEAAEKARRAFAEAERAAAAARSAAAAAAASRVTAIGIPEAYQAWYVAAAETCPGLRWTLLAAVGQVESRHGRSNGPSSAGAVGPMQFMPATFAAFGVDGGGDGVADPWDPADAIFTAAAYLCRHGAGGGTAEAERRALLRYNNAQWYVDLVLGVEADLLARGAS